MRVLCSSLYVAALVIVLVGVFVHGSMGCLEEEKVGLLKLKAAIDNAIGTGFLSWGSSGEVVDCCRWERVTCDNKTNRVIELDLSFIREWAFGMKWSLNASLLLPFHQLQILNLSESFLTGFEGLLVLEKLEVLLLSDDILTKVPILSGTPSLKVLDLSYNSMNINSSQLEGLKYLSSLEVLNLKRNSFMGSIPPIIGTLTSPQPLSLRGNLFNDSSSMEGLCKLSRLRELDVGYNSFEGNVPLCFNNLTSLRTLDISWNNFEGSFPSSLLSSLKLLEYICLSGNGFEGSFNFTSLYNHSKLVVFELVNNRNKTLKVEIDSSTHPRFQLRALRLSNCILNWETSRVTPSFLSNQYELRLVELNNDGIRGDFPNWLLVNNSKLEFFTMSGNQLLIGPIISLGLHSKQPYMRCFDISSNFIQGQIPLDIGFIFPNLTVLNMSYNALHGDFPPSIGNMTSLYILDLSNNNFSGVLPQNFFWACIDLRILILSNNKFHGNFSATSNFTSLSTLFLDNNRFSGEISNIGIILDSMQLKMLDFGNNSFSGQIPDWTGNFPDLTSLVLSGNHLEGIIPTSLCKLKELEHLDLSRNKLGPSIPSCFNLSNMKYLHLQSNKLTGVIPDVLSRGRSLVILDLKDNKFWGTIPPWIGSLTSLEVLLLGGNELNDSIPSHLCQLRSMRMLDLSRNNLLGSIPPCLNNLTFGSEGAQDDMFITNEDGGGLSYIYSESLYTYSYESEIIEDSNIIEIVGNPYVKAEGVDFTTKWRFESYEGRILPLMSGMDLSSNNLVGDIPSELGDLSQIHSLNLSWNHLSGPIPTTFSNLKAIESLDLSHNMLNGQIPPKMIELNSLAVFTVAYNNLSGKLPERQAQFATFEESSYQGNPLICGLPLNRSCTAPPLQPATSSDDHDNDEEKEYSLGALFLWSFGGSFGVAFLGILAFLYLNNYYRELLFYFVAKHMPFLPL